MPPQSRTLLVTGASTGIGRAVAEAALARGRRVVATVRRAEDESALRDHARAAGRGGALEVLRLDVTDEEAVAAAPRRVAAFLGPEGRLDELVLNAGIAVPGPLERLPLERLRRQFEVNVFGLVACLQAFLPHVRRARGRVVLVSSQAGRLAFPMLGAYSASKYAVEALGDALRLELAPFGVDVVLVEPGAVATEIWERSLADASDLRAGLEDDADYAPLARAVERGFERAVRNAIPAEECAAAILDACEAKRAPIRVPVGRDARRNLRLARWLPARWVDALVRRELGIRRR